MTEVPEHLLARSQSRRAALGLGGDAPAAPVGAPTTDMSPATTGGGAPAPAAAAAPVPATGGAAPPAPPPPPPPPYVQAAMDRKRIPIWAMPVLAFLPLWGFIYVQTLEPPPVTEVTILQEGGEIYAANCAGCHGGGGGGGAGRPLSDGAVVATFPNILDQIQFTSTGSAPFQGQPYGDPEREGGAHIGGETGANMPAFGESLTDEEIVAVVRYEREVLAGEELPETVTLGELDVLVNAEGEEVFLFDTAGTLVDSEGTPILENGWLLPEFAEYVGDLAPAPAPTYPDLAAAG